MCLSRLEYLVRRKQYISFSPDDIFKLTITLQDDGTTVETFTHQKELTWTGLRDFSFSDTVGENTYGVLTGMFSLYGIDAGYPVGYYGPQFSEPSLTIDYLLVCGGGGGGGNNGGGGGGGG